MSVVIPRGWKKGLGTQIMALSVINHSKYNEVKFLESSNEYYNFKFLVSYYNLPLSVTLSNDKNADDVEVNFGDFSKMYSPYFKKEASSKNSKSICLCMYQDVDQILETPKNTDFPYNKFYTIDEYAEIFKFIRRMGYDIITVDSKDITLLEKIETISKCAAVIGYEGGMAHLTHTLNVPYIMLPWRYKDYEGNKLVHLLHLDKKTYFLKDIDELISFNKDAFFNLLNILNIDKGNNYFFKNTLSKDLWNRLPISKTEKKFFPSNQLGGYHDC